MEKLNELLAKIREYVKKREAVPNHRKIQVIIDPGHGGYDFGLKAHGKYNKGYNNILEKDIVLEIATRLGWLCARHQIGYMLTRWGDRFISLDKRCKMANSTPARLYISLHCNYAKNPKIKGMEVYHHPKSPKGMVYAKRCISLIDELKFTRNRGRKSEEFYVLRRTKMPSILIEFGFLTNKDDAEYLNNQENQNAVACKVLELIKEVVL